MVIFDSEGCDDYGESDDEDRYDDKTSAEDDDDTGNTKKRRNIYTRDISGITGLRHSSIISTENPHIKSKRISEDYKFSTLTTTQGFVADVILDERTAAKVGRQEYSVDRTEREINFMVLFVTSFVDTF
eukprot:3577456-Ditylum_brightwellii.AAC.1